MQKGGYREYRCYVDSHSYIDMGNSYVSYGSHGLPI